MTAINSVQPEKSKHEHNPETGQEPQKVNKDLFKNIASIEPIQLSQKKEKKLAQLQEEFFKNEKSFKHMVEESGNLLGDFNAKLERCEDEIFREDMKKNHLFMHQKKMDF